MAWMLLIPWKCMWLWGCLQRWLFPPQSKYYAAGKRHREPCLSWAKKIKNKKGQKGGENAKVSVLGAGSWGTALSLLLCKNGHEVTLWSALEDEVRMLCEKREHESKLPGVRLPEDMKITADLEDSLQIRT